MVRVRRDSDVAGGQLPTDLKQQITACGFFPQLISDSVGLAVGEEPVEAYLVHHEATFAHEGFGRHLSVLVLTASRLVVCHTDESAEDPAMPAAISSTESVPMRAMGTVALTRVIAHPEQFGSEAAPLVETWLTLNWQTVRKVDLEPASCGDPSCEADHGLTGSSMAEDMVIRMSVTADGPDQVARLVRFGTLLQHRVG